MPPLVSVLILTEDKDGHDTIEAVTEHIFRLIVPEVRVREGVSFEPLPEARLRRAVQPSVWRSRADADERLLRDLRRTIASQLFSTPASFVVFHFDGDATWSDRASSTHEADFRLFVAKVEQVMNAPSVHRVPSRENVSQRIAEAKGRLLALVPFYSIEAWLYQSADLAKEMCKSGCGRHVERFETWRANRAELDEVPKPKDAVCFGAKHNHDLARALPTNDLQAVGKSFAATIDAWKASDELVGALTRTYAESG